MKYYHYEQEERMKAKAFNWKLDGVLQKYFPDNNKWGADVLFDLNDVRYGNITLQLDGIKVWMQTTSNIGRCIHNSTAKKRMNFGYLHTIRTLAMQLGAFSRA